MRVDGCGRVPTSLLKHPQAHVGRDPVHPRDQRRSRLEAVDVAPGPEHRLLHRIVGVVQRAEDPVAVPMQRLAVWRGQSYEGLFVAALGGDEHGVVEGRRLHWPSGVCRRDGGRPAELRPR